LAAFDEYGFSMVLQTIGLSLLRVSGTRRGRSVWLSVRTSSALTVDETVMPAVCSDCGSDFAVTSVSSTSS